VTGRVSVSGALETMVTGTTEPDQWEQRGGPATIRFFRDRLVVLAAPYIHRQLTGHSRL